MDFQDAPQWVQSLPAMNAALNGLAAVMLVVGYLFIRSGRVASHKRTMLAAFGVSVLFLACYLTYHFALHAYTGRSSRPFEGEGLIRPVYYTILITHVVLAAIVPVLAIITIYRALKGDWERHRRIAKLTLPIWLYVSVTGVIIYGMLYHWS